MIICKSVLVSSLSLYTPYVACWNAQELRHEILRKPSHHHAVRNLEFHAYFSPIIYHLTVPLFPRLV
jgi:hypothetical protein